MFAIEQDINIIMRSISELTLTYNETLNPVLFTGNHLKNDVREHLLAIAKAFISFAKIPEETIQEIVGIGGNFNYNYTNFSDIDCHIIIDKSKIPIDKIWLDEYLQTKKAYWIARHRITIKGYNTELYIQGKDDNPFPNNAGVYSLTKDSWIQEPVNQHLQFGSNDAIDREADNYEQTINKMIDDNVSSDELNKIKKQIQIMRVNAVRSDGEYSTGNLIFKELRNRGVLDKINNYILLQFDRNLSEGVLKEWDFDKKIEKWNTPKAKEKRFEAAFKSIQEKPHPKRTLKLAMKMFGR